ncbi:MAG: hypothetical protein M3Q78_04845 [Acidobacteriota bacterium]|nr:hypothetical protein [Acidobacteriota bacterium]
MDERDPHHADCSTAYKKEFYPLLPDVVLPELAVMNFSVKNLNGNVEYIRGICRFHGNAQSETD